MGISTPFTERTGKERTRNKPTLAEGWSNQPVFPAAGAVFRQCEPLGLNT